MYFGSDVVPFNVQHPSSIFGDAPILSLVERFSNGISANLDFYIVLLHIVMVNSKVSLNFVPLNAM